MTGAIPVFLTPTRNHFGIIGPIPLEEFRWENIEKKIKRASVRARSRRPAQAARTDAHAEHLRRHRLQRRDDQGRCSTARSTRCTSTKPGCRTRRFTNSTATCTRSARTGRALQGIDDFFDAVDAQDAGRVCRRRRRSWCRTVAERETRSLHVQRSVPDAHVDFAAVRDHRVVRRRRGDDGAARRHRAGRGVDSRGARLPPRDAQGRRGVRQDWWFKVWGPEQSRRRRHRQRATTGCSSANERWHGFGDSRRASTCSIRSRRR